MTRRQVLVRSLVAVVATCGIVISYALLAGADPAVRFPRLAYPPTPRAVYSPSDVVRDPGGITWVADSGNNRVLKLSETGELLATWDSDGAGTAFSRPTAIALSPSGRVYVADTNNHRIVILAADGAVEGTFGQYGSGDGGLNSPSGIGCDASGDVFVSDTLNDRVQRFTGNGHYVASYGSSGSLPGQLKKPRGMSVSGTQVFVADSGNRRVAVLTTDGAWVTSWGPFMSGEFSISRYNSPSDVSVSGDTLYVADTGNYQVEACTTGGTPLVRWGSNGGGDGQFKLPGGVWSDGVSVWVADTGNHRVVQHATSGVFLQTWRAGGSGPSELDSPKDVALDGARNTYVADTDNGRVQKFSPSGDHLLAVGAGELSRPEGVAVDVQGAIYVADTGNNVVRKYTSGGVADALFGEGTLVGPRDVAVAGDGTVYVVDSGNHMVRIYTPNGDLLHQWGGSGTGAMQFSSPSAIAVSGNRVFVSDTGNSRISQFEVGAGISHIGSWGGLGSARGAFAAPSGVAVATNGNVWVCDSGNDRLQEFTSAGVFVSVFGRTGGSLGEFHWPSGIAAGPDGLLVVVERQASRAQVLPLDSEVPFTAISGVPDSWSREVTVTLTATDDVGVASTHYKIGAGEAITYAGPFGSLPEGQSSIYYSSVDLLGRVEIDRVASARVDRTPPLSTSNLDGGWYHSPFAVVLSRADALSGAELTTYSVDGGMVTEYTGSFSISGEGDRSLRFRSTDAAGNAEIERTASVRIDDTPPVTTSDATALWRATPETLTLECTDGRSGPAGISYRIGSGPLTSYSGPFAVAAEGQTTVSFGGVDHAGNAERPQLSVVRIDRLPPVTLIGVGALREDGTRLVTLTASDAGVGSPTTYFRIDGEIPGVYGAPFSVDADVPTTVSFWSIDSLGNRELTQTALVDYDFDPPSTTSDLDGVWRKTPASVSLVATDAMSGVRGTYYRLSGSAITTYTGSPFTVSTEGQTEVTFWSVDLVGIREADKVGWVRIDRTAPVATSTVTFDPYQSSAIITLAADDTAGVGLGGIQYRLGTSGAWLDYIGGFYLGTSGENVLQFRAVDLLGNGAAHIEQRVVTLRQLVPKTESSIDALWHRGDVTVHLNSSYEGTAPVSTYYRIGTNADTSYAGPFSVSAEGETQVRFWSVANGVTEQVRQAVVRIDRVAPQTTYAHVASTNPSRVTVTLSMSDVNGSGVATTYYRVGNGATWTQYTAPFVVQGGAVVWYRSVDRAGNQEVAKSQMLAPVTTANVVSTRWYRMSATVVLTPAHPTGAPTITYYRLVGQAVGTRYTGPFIVSREGLTAIQFWSVADGVSETRKQVNVHVDRTGPKMTYLASPTHPSNTTIYRSRNVRFRWAATDALSGVYGYSYVLDRRPITYPSTARTSTATSAYYASRASGIWYFHVRARDKAGMWGPTRHIRVRIR